MRKNISLEPNLSCAFGFHPIQPEKPGHLPDIACNYTYAVNLSTKSKPLHLWVLECTPVCNAKYPDDYITFGRGVTYQVILREYWMNGVYAIILGIEDTKVK